MNKHDIELPPLVGTLADLPERHKEVIEAYGQACARAAIEADRKRRGEPVAWAMFADNGNIRIWARKPISHPDCVPLYTAPQPDDFSAQLNRIDESMKAGARLTKHRLRLDAPQPAEPVSQHPDDAAVDAFAVIMKAKLKRARDEKGRGGWQDMSAAELSAMLREHVEKGDPVDVANLAMMLSLNGQRIAPAEPVKVPSVDLAHEIWAAAQTAPGEGIEDAVERVAALLARYGKGAP